ncbi:ABC transporter ATP-binding protein/permease [Pokkaliibacter sp. CJK22405]|uniref:ABC transporter ATP-binding protein/permease n=1 Tax=Pokkaliibacter sp. CJK22405 TaxID=3384615 RepID=UPI003984E0FC
MSAADSTLLDTRSHRHFLRKAWALTSPYWSRSEERKSAWLLLIVIISMALANVYLSVWFNSWYRDFYNALQDKNVETFWVQVGWFCPVALISIALSVYQYYLTGILQIRWRRWLTDVYFKRWLGEHAYYLLEVSGDKTDNPDQRISEDINQFTDTTLSLTLGLLRSVVTLFSFIAILWGLSGPLSFTLSGHEITIPGYMVWVAVIYAVVGSYLTHKVGSRLIGLNFEQQRVEANLRFSMIRIRENAERVALYGGEQEEMRTLKDRFQGVWSNFWQIMRVQKRLIAFTSGYAQVAVIFPIVVAAPRYFSGAIQLGGLMQINSAFGRVQDALSWFIDAYSSLAVWRSVVDRLTSFNERLDAAERAEQAHSKQHITENRLELSQLTLKRPDHHPLKTIHNLSIEAGQHTLISAPSGSGKSVLFRTLAGIWPWWQGEIGRPASTLFLPQTPYLPIDRLKAVISYPEAPDTYSDEAVRQALIDCRLEAYVDRLEEEQHWAHALSPGEQQRIAIARALLKAPAWLFLDEATSALDKALESHLYQLLKSRLPNTTLISIAHREQLEQFHEQRWLLSEDRMEPIAH